MANIIDYIDWRGDLTFKQAPFNEVDNLILSEISYLNFTGIVPSPKEGGKMSIQRATKLFFKDRATNEPIDMGVLLPDIIPELLEKMEKSSRYGDLYFSNYVDWLDNEQSQQFAALTIELGDGTVYLSFRGTDDSLAGWKEDFLIGCLPEVPSQKLAVQYVKLVAPSVPRKKIRLGGHSKGGNLAVYGGVFCPANIQRRILNIYSNDGPGFHESLLSLVQHKRLEGRIVSIVPESSLVGMLFQHEEAYTVVKSNQQGLMQHDGFSWEVLGDGFVHMKEISKESQFYDKAMQRLLSEMRISQREQFVDSLFAVLTASGALTLSDLRDDSFKAVSAMVRAMKDMDKVTRDALFQVMKLCLHTNVKMLVEELQQGDWVRSKRPKK